ncbi:dCMP deaminase [Pseudomonas phage vB_PpuM-NoPa]|uniref:dCMP deaminase n=2 Tax=Tartuvirus TaxID=3424912 RepID=A0AAX4MXL4_9CAUD
MKTKHIRAYMECAYAFARCSPATRLKVGAVLVKQNRIISCGYNALPEALDGPCEDETGKTRPEVRHAEENALRALVRSPESAVGATMFVTHWCCLQCAIDVVDAGVVSVYTANPYRSGEGIQYLKDNGVEVIFYEKEDDPA